jgi:4-nitrophenyl phosphatase
VTSPPVVLCDLDGVIWLADSPLPGAAEAVAGLRARGIRVAFATNNSSLTIGDYLAKLAGFGIDCLPDDLVTSAMAAADDLRATLATGARVLACAGPGVVEALHTVGFTVVDAEPCDAVVVGWHRTFDYDRLSRAATAVRAGARFVATNADPTYPAPEGLIPGNGALVAAVATAAERPAEVAGKPFPPMTALVRQRFGEAGVMVGDRPSTDGKLAAALGWPFVLVASSASATEVLDPRPAVRAARLIDAVDEIVALAQSRAAGVQL